MTAGAIDWVMSLDPTWYSSMYGFMFLVGQGYAVLALVILGDSGLSKAEPIKTILRVTEQHDLGKLCLRLRHAEHLHRIFAVPDHLVGQPAR